MNIEDYFNCPNCNSDLNRINNGYQCINCSSDFHHKGGLPNFLPEGINTELSKIPHPEKLYRKAKKIGWETAAIEFTRDYLDSRDYIEYADKQIISEAPGDFQYLLPINKESIVLVIGVSWGNIISALTRNTKFVFALDVNADLLHFSELRLQQERLSNIKLIQGASSSLPVKEMCFDAIILNGSFEQLVYERLNNFSDQLVSDFLTKIFYALKPDGILYIATENRFNFNYFIGKKEAYSNLRFVTILPCKVVTHYFKLRRRINFRCAYFSSRKLKNMLVESGFGNVVFNFPIPSYRNLRYMSEIENRAVYIYLIKLLGSFPKFSRLHSIAGLIFSFFPLSILKFFWPDFCIVAKRP